VPYLKGSAMIEKKIAALNKQRARVLFALYEETYPIPAKSDVEIREAIQERYDKTYSITEIRDSLSFLTYIECVTGTVVREVGKPLVSFRSLTATGKRLIGAILEHAPHDARLQGFLDRSNSPNYVRRESSVSSV